MVLLFALLTSGCRTEDQSPPGTVLVAAASDLVKVSRPLGVAFERSYRQTVTFSFGSSGQLGQQIRQGAPFDVYAPAARAFCQSLAQDGFIETDCRVYAEGRLVAWSKAWDLKSLAELKHDRIHRLAVANPQYAPYGMAAQQALQSAGLWEAVQPKLILADSVAHAFQMAQTGNADVALVARALVEDAGRPFLVIDQSLHQPIEQTAAVLKASANQEAARAFVEFLSSPQARQILQAYGFGLP